MKNIGQATMDCGRLHLGFSSFADCDLFAEIQEKKRCENHCERSEYWPVSLCEHDGNYIKALKEAQCQGSVRRWHVCCFRLPGRILLN
jgi:hypothetical protein